jgi:mediator of RNA polymerase II transcription subunit 17
LAALRRNPDGTISLDQGIASSEPRTLRVRIRIGNNQTGASASPQPVAEDAPIEALILQARNTIFSEELWQEMNREARTLGSYGVQSRDDTLICPLTATKTAVFDLVPVGESTLSGPDDNMAEGVFISLNLLLTYSHRQNLRRRTQPPPPISAQKKVILPYNLLRAVLTRLKHQETVGQLNNLLGPLCHVMESAQLKPLPTFKVTSTPGTPPAQLPQAEQTILSLVDRLETIATFSMSESTTITIAARTSSFPVGSTFFVSLPPSSPLMSVCPPPQVLTSYPALRDYIHYFTACAVATSIATIPSSSEIDEADIESQAGQWHQTPHPTTLRTVLLTSTAGSKIPKTKQLSISVQPLTSRKKSGIRLRAYWEWNGKEQQEVTVIDERKSSFGFPVLLEDVQMSPKEDSKNLRRGLGEGVYDWVAWEKESGKLWDDGEGEVFRTLESVLADAGK